ncbi:hypothetical protein B5E53_07855 [Eubacterium sp. An11]|uniref:glycosyltransferase family 2 protein n=1 Tax=Eubacterium sp. An11 TaxID=1965542 RepID=UPI000B38C1DC|nr:glycosyltransferase family A protein [Eubacterium sp. An11]OUQ67900.1 hypothetical protein B5E53_07855 [Eubacterium sp. An11]
MNHVVDVIVPVYNVKNYLIKCIDSLLNQNTVCSYGIILVDDGSTDGSDKICDIFAKRFPYMINVIHKKNGGLSEARNYGVKFSNAQYIIFVDSDDYVDGRFIQSLYDALVKESADMVVAPICKEYVNKDGSICRSPSRYAKKLIMNTKEALIELCYEKYYGSYAVSKIIKTSILREISFPLGKYFEDSFTIYKFIAKCKRIVCIPEEHYYYLQRNGSIQHREFETRHMDLVFASVELLHFAMNYNDVSLTEAAEYKVCKSLHITLRHAIDTPNFSDIYNLLIPYCRNCLKNVLHNKRVIFHEKIIFMLMLSNKSLYKILFRIVKRKSEEQ